MNFPTELQYLKHQITTTYHTPIPELWQGHSQTKAHYTLNKSHVTSLLWPKALSLIQQAYRLH